MSRSVLLVLLLFTGQIAPPPDYAALYEGGVPFATFLEGATARKDEWRKTYNDAAVSAEMLSRLRGLPERRRLLVVAEDKCGDSAQTIPHLARMVDGAPNRLELRIVNSKIGRSVMEAHRTADDRAATPTVVVLADDGRFIAAWVERPAPLQAQVIEQKKTLSKNESHERMRTWYAQDAGKTATAEIAALLAR